MNSFLTKRILLFIYSSFNINNIILYFTCQIFFGREVQLKYSKFEYKFLKTMMKIISIKNYQISNIKTKKRKLRKNK